MRPPLIALLCAAVFLISGLRHLDAVPRVYEDEPWQASTAFKLLTQGVFGSDLFSGFYGMEHHYYGFMPLHPLLLSVVFRVLGGVGLLQARLETVFLTLLTLGLTFALGTRLFNAWVGALAVALLVLVRWTGLTYIQLTGIPVVDFARIARYDPLVPVIGLSALHIYLAARPWAYFGAGSLAGLAGLAHLYGLFWLPALGLLAIVHGRPKAAALIAIGGVLPWLPYAAYVLQDVPDWRGQTMLYADRFGLLNPGWYVDNLLQEYHRYGPGLGPFGPAWLLRVGLWSMLIALPVSLAALVSRAVRRRDAAAQTLVIPALVLPVLFALLIKLKLVNYTLVELPLFAIVVAWGAYAAWWHPVVRPFVATLAVLIALEGAAALGRLEDAATTTTPYPTFAANLRQTLPAGARVLGLHTYWFGLEDVDYRSFLLPLIWADQGVPLDQALARVAPDVVLLDPRMRDYFNAPEVAADRQRYVNWLSQHQPDLIGRFDDPTYGLMEVYRLQR